MVERSCHAPYVEYMPLYEDDRGSVYCVQDNLNVPAGSIRDFSKRGTIVRTYLVHNWERGRIRAWHGHQEAWTGMHVIQGAAKLVARPINEVTGPVKIVTMSDRKPGILWVPPGYYNGSMSLTDNTKILVYSTLSFDKVKNDDVRMDLTDTDVLTYFKVVDR